MHLVGSFSHLVRIFWKPLLEEENFVQQQQMGYDKCFNDRSLGANTVKREFASGHKNVRDIQADHLRAQSAHRVSFLSTQSVGCSTNTSLTLSRYEKYSGVRSLGCSCIWPTLTREALRGFFYSNNSWPKALRHTPNAHSVIIYLLN